MVTQVLKIDLADRSYPIVVGEDLLKAAKEYLIPNLTSNKIVIITDDNVAKLYLSQLTDKLKEFGIHAEQIILPAGEKTKSFTKVEEIVEKILLLKPDRKITLIALGGGVVGDITGFTASILLRGVNFIQMPTTLLAQVDSSVGGKTGVNSKYGKNLIGSFYQPKLVLADSSFLATLSKREFLSGYAEVIKYGLIMDADFFTYLDKNLPKILNKDSEVLKYIVFKCCEMKAQIVAKDEKEQGLRALLNFGHTFGHALESITGYSDVLLHGEGVGIGMLLAARLSAKVGLCGSEIAEKIEKHLNLAGLPTNIKSLGLNKTNIGKIIEIMQQDKKVSNGKMIFILLEDVGKSIIVDNITVDSVVELLENSFI